MKKLLWIDLEMTGLDVEKEVVIEIAAIITDLDFKELDNYQAVLKQPPQYLENMDAWNKEHHTKSGLLDKIPYGENPDHVEDELCQLIIKHFNDEPAVIAGNSIAQDRVFIRKYFKKLEKHLHYRMLDVTSLKLIFYNIFNICFDKKNNHRALEDIRESIAELKEYMKHIHKNK